MPAATWPCWWRRPYATPSCSCAGSIPTRNSSSATRTPWPRAASNAAEVGSALRVANVDLGRRPMLAVLALAHGVQRQRMLLQRETARRRHLALARLDLGVEKFLDAATGQAQQVVVVRALVEFEHRLAGFEMAACENAGLLELHQHP